MDLPKYAKLENERRFLVVDCPDLATPPGRLIEDIYLDNCRLRLRAITEVAGAREFKLCKKYGSDNPASGPVVNIYLSATEHAVLARLPGRALRKRRHPIRWQGRTYSVDVFEGELQGLVICEAEAESPTAIQELEFPPWAEREVTNDPFYTGGHLAKLSAAELKAHSPHERLCCKT
jgi:CYTH domain-containing protein